MKLVKQIIKAFDEQEINGSDLLEVHFDRVLDVLRQHCLAYGKRVSSLAEEDLAGISRETSGYLLQRFQKHDIDIKEIHIETGEPVINKFVSTFMFIFQRRLVERVKQRNQGLELMEELLEDFEGQGIEEFDMEAIPGLQKRLLETENLSKTEKLVLEFMFSKINHFTDFQTGKDEAKVNETGISQLRSQLRKKLERSRQELEQILLNV